MENMDLKKVIQENGSIVIKNSLDNAFAKINVCGSYCIFKMYGENNFCESIISCQTDDKAQICQEKLSCFILTGDPEHLNWYIGMDYDDVRDFFFHKKLAFAHYEIEMPDICGLAERINECFPDESGVLIYVESANGGAKIIDEIKFSRWIQYSVYPEMAEKISVSIWYK